MKTEAEIIAATTPEVRARWQAAIDRYYAAQGELVRIDGNPHKWPAERFLRESRDIWDTIRAAQADAMAAYREAERE